MDSMNTKNPLVWIDCEMTGLDVQNDVIIEIFCIITNGDLELLDEEGWGAIIQQSQETMDKMGEWCSRTHGESGLTKAVLQSKTSPEEAASALLIYIQKFVPETRCALLAGNSVHADREFLRREPYTKILNHLHYRIFDVSTLKEAARFWSPASVLQNMPPKKSLHKAKDDIIESIAEAKYYRENIFRPQGIKSCKFEEKEGMVR
ncbi:hypothetical protein K3495_g5483 [Podosphaera aphanis]|nr:hypothetical protein K3495_g5483 [Podosphaera aphanis]